MMNRKETSASQLAVATTSVKQRLSPVAFMPARERQRQEDVQIWSLLDSFRRVKAAPLVL